MNEDGTSITSIHYKGIMIPNDPSPNHRLPLAHYAQARALIDPVFRDSPQYECEALNDALGAAVTLKAETANPIRSFKGRGAAYLVRSMPQSATPLVSASAGNWGQALAYACRGTGRKLILFASVKANPLKVERMRALGAEVRLHGEDFDEAKIEAARFAASHGFRMVADGLDLEASIGAGTMAMELTEREAKFDAVIVPLGNGAMLTGIGRWMKAVSPGTAVIGVQATGADAMEKSWRTGKLLFPARVDTIADGIGVRVPIAEAVADMKDTVDDVVLVEDDSIIRAMRLLFSRAGLITEPSGAAGIAALLAHRQRFEGKRIATIICGGNITEHQFKTWVMS
jgi:threonine dehydratase